MSSGETVPSVAGMAPSSRRRTTSASTWLVPLACSVSLGVACWMSFGSVLGWYFIDVDTFALISTGRVRSWTDLWGVLSRPLMGDLMPNARFFRPLSSLSWGLDERLWGLEPLGYHLTDFLLHTGNALLLLVFTQKLWCELAPRRTTATGAVEHARVVACVAALLFAVSPAQAEFLPAIARRPDLLTVFLALVTWITILRALEGHSGRRAVLAGVWCFLGLAAKETSIVIPVTGALLWLLGLRIRQAEPLFGAFLRRCWPLVLATGLHLVWRTLVLNGLGGYSPIDDSTRVSQFLATLWTQALLLVAPGHLNAVSAVLRALALPIGGLAACVLVYLAAAVIRRWRRGAELDARLLWLLGGFLSLGALPALVGRMWPRQMYLNSVFFALLLAWLSVRFWHDLRNARTIGVKTRAAWGHWLSGGSAVATVIAMLSASPLLGGDSGLERWRRTGEVARSTLESAEPYLAQAREETTVFLVNFPYRLEFGDDRAGIEQPEAPILLEHSVQGWADLRFPGKRLDVVGLTYLEIGAAQPIGFDVLTTFSRQTRLLEVSVERGAFARLFPWPNDFGRHNYRLIYRSAAHRRATGEETGRGIRLQLYSSYRQRPVLFLVYTGKGVVQLPFESFSIKS